MTGSEADIHVLHVDDEPDFAELAAQFIEREHDSIAVHTAARAAEGLELLGERAIDCIISDYDMPAENGLEFLRAVREDHPDLPFILFTGKGSEEVASEAISAGVTGYLQKEAGTDQYTVLANRIRNVVTGQRASEAAEQRRHRLQQILKTVPACVVQTDRDGEFIYANDRAKDVLGLKPSDVTDRTYNDPAWRITDLDGEPIPDEELPFRQVRDSGEPVYGYRHMVEWPDGTRKALHVNGAPLFDEDGDVKRTVFALTDITEKIDRERELRRQRHFIDSALDSLADIFYVVTPDGEFLRWNEQLPRVTGYSDDEIADMNALEFFDGDDISRIQEFFEQILETGEAVIEANVVTKDGTAIPYSSRGCTLADPEGELLGIVGISRDISDRRERERRMERQNERLEEFAKIVSHDLRNPLAVAQGRLDLVRETVDHDDLDAIDRAHQRMEVLIEDLLTLAREGDAVREVERVELDALARECWRTIDGMEAALDVASGLVVEADRPRLKQLLENLLRNAIEHGGAGVEITIGALDDGFYVEDDGPGIPEADRGDVFSAGYTTTRDGTGYGLSIVEEVVDAHGWGIRISDGSEGGARFEVTGVEAA